MPDRPLVLTDERLRTPRAAALAGILFAVLHSSSIVLIRLAVPPDVLDHGAWLRDRAGSVALALNLVPFAGIAFLWFMGVVRDRIGFLEDQFFSTVFFGSGLLFLALTFVSSALAGGLLAAHALEADRLIDSGLYTLLRAVMVRITSATLRRQAGRGVHDLAGDHLRPSQDHSIAEIKKSCYAVVMTVGWDSDGHAWTLDLFRKKNVGAKELLEEIFRQYQRYPRVIQVGVEGVGFQRVYRFAAEQTSTQNGVWLPWKELKPNYRSKESRIDGLEPVARAHKLHIRKGHEALIDEFIRYPYGEYRDGIDAFAYQLDLAHAPVKRNREDDESKFEALEWMNIKQNDLSRPFQLIPSRKPGP